jgi:ribosome biogenesis GTPase A
MEDQTMPSDKVRVHLVNPSAKSEEAYFAEQDKKLLQQLREKSAKEADEKYAEEHKYHCFRCGTRSLAEIDEGHVKIDVCVNEGCGAVHLDPGELKEILESKDSETSLKTTRNAFLSIFKK